MKHAEALVRFAATLVGPADAEDIVAGVITALLRTPGRDLDDLRAYLYRCTANAARQHWRSTSRRERREALTAPMEAFAHHEFIPEVAAALATLSPQQRAVVHLVYWEDLTPEMTAARLGVSDGTVRCQLARSRRHLAEVLRRVG